MQKKLTVKRRLQAYQCDRYGNMRPLILMNELQEMGDIHAEKLGIGYKFCQVNGLAWVVTHYLVDIIEMPTQLEELTLSTWPACHDSLRATRDFEIHGADGRLLVRATSQWVLIDLVRRHLVRLDEHLAKLKTKQECRAWDRTFDKFADFTPQKTHTFKCRFDDIDVNQHINNAVYAVWATESVGYAFRNSHMLRRIEINFKKEVKPDTPEIAVDVAIDGNTSRHKIRTGDVVNAAVMCTWTAREE